MSGVLVGFPGCGLGRLGAFFMFTPIGEERVCEQEPLEKDVNWPCAESARRVIRATMPDDRRNDAGCSVKCYAQRCRILRKDAGYALRKDAGYIRRNVDIYFWREMLQFSFSQLWPEELTVILATPNSILLAPSKKEEES